MASLQLKQLTLVSDTSSSANLFKFSSRFNLITANDNSVGKSTLAKLLMWVFGCEPDFDDAWKALDCKAIIDFNINNLNYQIARYGNTMFLAVDGADFVRFPKISGDYSKAFANLVNFKVLLPNKQNPNKLETPPPAYYFLPFYLDQLRSWSRSWESFNNLQQYSSWQKTIIKYHTGYLSSEYFDIEEEIAGNRAQIHSVSEELKRIDTAMEVVTQYSPIETRVFATDQAEFDSMTKEIEIELVDLQNTQEIKLQKMAELQVEHQYLDSQFKLVTIASNELEKDYTFSVERLDGEEIQCPLCGVIHDNSLANRASILVDKEEALEQAATLSGRLDKVNKNISKLKTELAEIRSNIDNINMKYVRNDESETSSHSILDFLAVRSVEKLVNNSKQEKVVLRNDISTKAKALKKEQTLLLDKEKKETLDSQFQDQIAKYVSELNASGINLSNVISPLDYRKITGGGAAEITRGVLAYHMTVLKQIYNVQNEVCAPLVIDTPNQQEQTFINYDRIISLLLKESPSSAQVILCAMNSEALESYKKVASIIELDEDKLLDKNKYNELKHRLKFLETIY